MHKPDFTDRKTAEKYSSAFTLSDMEVFIFPELFYPLVLSNIMSPAIWRWRDDQWFADIEKRSFNYRINRIKQYIIQNYVFNLDLSTWGLTSKSGEIDRFSDFFDMEMLKQSNALFGYEGDRYYFSLDIRKHFGLDSYNDDVIPYWKTETIEAMNGFRHKEAYSVGAGECVSLSALYAAALFVIGRVDLKDIFLLATPLHSQNFITEKEGVITNNRRIVTKNMWFNGTSLSAKARRAIENEKITIVAHISGHVHTVYERASINPESYAHFSAKLKDFLTTELNKHVFINFLRFKGYKTLFQYRDEHGGKPRYISLEKLFEYEHSSKFSVGLDSREQLINEIDGDEFSMSVSAGRLMLNDFEEILDRCSGKNTDCILKEIKSTLPGVLNIVPEGMFDDLRDFLKTEPRLPSSEKEFVKAISPAITTTDTRDQIIEEIRRTAQESEMSLLALYVYRDMESIDWSPFIKAAIERNNVAFSDFERKTYDEVYMAIDALSGESVYEGKRLAQPDEVWNFRHGDGIEKALLMASWIRHTDKDSEMILDISGNDVVLSYSGKNYTFRSTKGLSKRVII